MEVDVLGVRDIRRGRKTPARRVDRPERRKLGPAASEVVTAEKVSGLRARKNPGCAAETGAGEAVHVVLGQTLVATLPGAAAVLAREQRAVFHAREDRT